MPLAPKKWPGPITLGTLSKRPDMCWKRIRDDRGFVYYEGWVDFKVILICPNDHYKKKWKVQILDHSPFHRRTLKSAKKEAEHIYAATRQII
jgi:hypothetical protein